jgi:hypothetical protein
MTLKTLLVKSKAPSPNPNQNYVKLKLSCANITWLVIAKKVTIAPSLTVVNNLKPPQNTKSACMVRDTASLGLHVDSYTKTKLKNCKNQIKCKKCNHNHIQQMYISTTVISLHQLKETHMTMPRVSKISMLIQSLT